ncbi:MAG: mechanosensitive ion channel family protein [Candidatus Kapaibacteriota bacterium]
MNIANFLTSEKIIELSIIIVIFFVLLVIINLVLKRLKILLSDKISFQTLLIFNRFVLWGFIALYSILILTYFGVKLTGILAVGGLVSIIIGFAAQKVVGNFIAGLFLIFEKPIKMGQSVIINDFSGIVEEIRFLSTIMRTFQGEFVRIPNELVFTSPITNLTENIARRVDYIIGIRYSDDFEKAKEVVLKFLDAEEYVLVVPKPEVFVEEFASSSVNVHIRFWVPTEKWYDVKNNLQDLIRNQLVDSGVEIPFPQMDINIKNLDGFNKL